MKLLTIAALLATTLLLPAQRPEYGDRRGVPDWEVPEGFENDAFTFARLRPRIHRRWAVDYPDSDLNFSFRLQQMTSMLVNPDPVVVDTVSPNLNDYPFLYLVEPGTVQLTTEEAEILREYLLNGGFLMLDDFWGEEEWRNTYAQLKRIFPDHEPVELQLDHPVFHAVFHLEEKPQIPAMEFAVQGREQGITTQPGGAEEATYYGVFDDEGRMMIMICRDTDLGDGWEREGDNPWFFKEFSEKKAYPMGINIIFHALTH